MPYLPPATTKPDHITRNHRRTISFDDSDQHSSTFQPLAGLPRRKHAHSISIQPTIQELPSPRPSTPNPRRAVFSLDHDDSTESDDSVEDQQEITQLARRPFIPLSIDTNEPTPTSPKDNSIPFPTLPGPRSPSPPSSPIHRTSSHPVILSNGRPLKSSLKSSSASLSSLADALSPLHHRSQSAPSTPATPGPKNVHFKDETDGSLENVKFFNKSGKPASINYGSGAEETETETEFESNFGASSSITFDGFPFPSSPRHTLVQAPSPLSSEIPATLTPGATNVILESVTVPHARPPVLRGSVLVRNITFAKSVAVRFTFDEWQTTSEVNSSYVSSLPSLPPPFQSDLPDVVDKKTGSVSWDWASAASQPAAWDRFSFSIKLEDVERKLLHSTMFIAVRYQAHGPGGGEWWDNNTGNNYKLSFQHKPISATEGAKKSVTDTSDEPRPNGPFNIMSHSPSFPPNNKTLDFGQTSNVRRPNALSRPVPVRAHSNPSIPTFATLGTIGQRSKSKLSLSNYVAPSPSVDDDDDEEDRKVSKVAPSSEPSPDLGADFVSSPTCIIGGMPATAPSVALSWPYSSATNTQPHQPRSQQSSFSTVDGPPTPIDAPPSHTPSPRVSPNTSAFFANNSHSNETYAEFVKKWCFHQSPPPISGSGAHTPTQASAVPRSSSIPAPSVTGSTTNPWMETFGGKAFAPNALFAGFERA